LHKWIESHTVLWFISIQICNIKVLLLYFIQQLKPGAKYELVRMIEIFINIEIGRNLC